MTPFDRISVSLTVIRRLQHVLTRETQALRSMQIAPLADLQPEKATLVDAYAAEVRHLRASPELFAALDDGVPRASATSRSRPASCSPRSPPMCEHSSLPVA